METEIVVEIGNMHEGSLGIAKSFVDMLAAKGVKFVKFQMHIPEFESSPLDEFRTRFSFQDKSRFDYWKRVQLNDESWRHLSEHCTEVGVEFMCTPFSIEAAQKLIDLTNIKRWKVGSGDAMNLPLIEFLSKTGMPMIISTGLISWHEVLELRKILSNLGVWESTTLLHCVSEYPTALERASLNVLDDLGKLGCKVGLSDHSGKLGPSLMALARGVNLIEVHMTPDRLFFGPDTSSSLDLSQIGLLVGINKQFQILNESFLTKDALFEEAKRNRQLFRKGMYWSRSLKIGDIVTLDDIRFLKPQLGVDAKHYKEFIGRILSRPVAKGDVVEWSQILNEDQ